MEKTCAEQEIEKIIDRVARDTLSVAAAAKRITKNYVTLCDQCLFPEQKGICTCGNRITRRQRIVKM